MGGTDLGLSLSVASSATSGVGQVSGPTINNGGGLNIPKWTAPLVIVGLFLIAIVIILRKH